MVIFFFFQAEDGIRDGRVTGVQTCALPIWPVAIVSHAFWRGKLAGDPGVVGRQIVLGGRSQTIVGVLPEPFFFALNRSDLWLPFPVSPAQAARSGYRVGVVARLAAGV